jgi:hypothetical protein
VWWQYVNRYNSEQGSDILCTNDVSKALGWVKEDLSYDKSGAVVESYQDTEKFFQFRITSANWSRYARVDRCSYMDRTVQADRGELVDTADELIGTISKRPVTVESAQEAVEYLVYLSTMRFSGYNVLSTIVVDENTSVHITMFLTMSSQVDTMGGGKNSHTIHLVKHEYVVNKETGAILRSTNTLRKLCVKY